MGIVDSLNSGISAHGQWKQRLAEAIKTGASDFTPAVVKQDNQCEFGKWLCSCSTDEKASPHYEKIKKMHTEFHQCAGSILEKALSGNTTDAEAEIGMGSQYRVISAGLTTEMMKWKDEVS